MEQVRFNSIQKKYLNAEAGAESSAPALPEKIKFNSIQKKYMTGVQSDEPKMTWDVPMAAGEPTVPDVWYEAVPNEIGDHLAHTAAAGQGKNVSASVADVLKKQQARSTLYADALKKEPSVPFPYADALQMTLHREQKEVLPAIPGAEQLFHGPDTAGMLKNPAPAAQRTMEDTLTQQEKKPSAKDFFLPAQGKEAERPERLSSTSDTGAVNWGFLVPKFPEEMAGPEEKKEEEKTCPPGTFAPESGWLDPETGKTWYDDGGREVWADKDTLQGIGVLPDGTVVQGGSDEFAYRLYKVIRDRENGTITPEEADARIRAIAEEIAFQKYPLDSQDVEREVLYEERLKTFRNRTLDYYDIPDITEKMDGIMAQAVKEGLAEVEKLREKYKVNSRDPLGTDAAAQFTEERYLYFRNQVSNGKPYDIKEWDEFQAHSLFIYNGEIISRDDTGNLLYGYLGTALGFSESELMTGAWINQTKTNIMNSIPLLKDDERDKARIRTGIVMYTQ